MPDGKVINQLYYGSGHLYNQSLHDPSTDEYIELRHSERNKLHQEISRQQGSLTSSYQYDPMGRLIKQQSLPSGASNEHLTIQRDYHYDALGQLTHLSGHSVLDTNKKTKQSTRNNQQQNQFTRNHQYQYDTQGRLTEHKLTDYHNNTGTTEVFAFDPASNRVPVSVANDTTDEAQNNHSRPRELIQNNQRIRYTYDSHGRVLYKTLEALNNPDTEPRISLQFQYNANNELEKSLRTQYQGNKVIKTQTVYHYDAFGRRIAKQSEVRQLSNHQGRLTQSSKTQYKHTHMLWDSDLPIQEYSDTHVYTTVYDQGSFKPVARLIWLRDDLPKVANDNIDSIDHHQDSSVIQVYHYHNDQLGTPNELTNRQGEVVWLADYEAWGNTAKVIYSESKLEELKVSKEHLQPIRFQGQHFDTETGLHYNRFRYYDPDMGMFISRDPIGLQGGDNVFAYAPNPTGWIDPLGLSCTSNANECGKNIDNLKKSCLQLVDEIKTFMYRDKRLSNNGGTHGLEHRFKEQINGKSGPGTSSWKTHEDTICNQQKGLRCRLQAHQQKGCGGPPPGAWKLATKPVPTSKEWKGEGSTAKDIGKGAAVGAAAVGGGYLVYRGFRMIPSLVIPPLWPTIPANAAIP